MGKVARALTSQRSVDAPDLDAVEDRWARAPFESMFALLDASCLGRT